LLSFAQFEREVTGERIRDKIAASKKKGMWMGGNVPLGYDTRERTLIINPAEAKTVRRIFALYLEFGCVRRVKQEADQLGLSTKRGMTADGCQRGGKPLSRGHIYRLLSNPIYTGQIAHKGQLYPGQHPALIDAEMWTAVQDQLVAKARRHRSKVDAAEPSLLTGMLTDAHGNRFTPSHAVRSGRRYRYYISAAPLTKTGEDRAQVWFACGPRRYHEILERLKANGVSINAGPLLVIPPAIHSFYFFDPNGIRLEITSDLDGDEEDLQVIRSCSMTETELRAELETISSDRAWIDEMVAAMTRDEIGSRDTPLPRG
jgi:catechol 2,3-dioxygenase-like lactoylglutathione lyase family enzyme